MKSINSEENSKRIFEDICQKLEKDFLPPIEREDIAGISHLLFEMSVNSFKPNVKLNYQMDLICDVISEIFDKKKTCGEKIRRLININSDFRPVNDSDLRANAMISDLLKKLNETYYKNL